MRVKELGSRFGRAGRCGGGWRGNHPGVLVVDAYNVIHTQGVLPPHLAGPEVHELIEMIGASRYKRHRAIVVCDGVPSGEVVERRGESNEAVARKVREERRGGVATVDVVFAGAGREADEAIEMILESHSAARRMLVVSTDRRVRRAAAKAGAASITSGDFLREIAADLERHKIGRGGAGLSHRPSFATDLPLSRLEVAYWLAHMGMDGEATKLREAAPVVVEERQKVGGGGRAESGKAGVEGVAKAGGAGESRVRPEAKVSDSPMSRGGEAMRGESAARAANHQVGVPGDGTPAWMHEAAKAWAGRLNLEELDTGKWLDSPLAPEPTHARTPSRARRKK